MSHHYPHHHCPYCNRTSYGPHKLETLSGFPIICAHCGAQDFKQTNHSTAKDQLATDCPIICPNCQNIMRVSQQEYEALSAHPLACSVCDQSLKLPDMPPLAPLPSALGVTLKLGVLYVLILASLGLLFTPQGANLITDLAQISDRPAEYLTGFQRRWYNIWHHFLSHLQGLFL